MANGGNNDFLLNIKVGFDVQQGIKDMKRQLGTLGKSNELKITPNFDISKGISNLQKDIKTITKTSPIKLDVEFDSAVINKLKKQIEEIKKGIGSGSTNNSENKIIPNMTQAQKNAEAFYNSVIEKTNQYKIGLMQLDEYIQKVQSQMYKKNGDYAPQFMNLDSSKQQQLVNNLNSALKLQERIANESNKINESISKQAQKEAEVDRQLKQQLSDFKKYAQLQTTNISNRYKNVNGVSENLDKYNNDLKNVIVSNGKLINSNTGLETSFGQLRQGLSNIRVEARNAQNWFSDLKDNIGKFMSWMGTATIFMQFVNNAKMAVSEINNLSDAVNNLSRVSDASETQLENIDKVAFKIANDIGGTAKGIVDSMADFSQLGYSYKESLDLAQTTSKYATAGFMDMKTATDAVSASYAVFNGTFDKAMNKIVDAKTIVDLYNKAGKLSIAQLQW